VESRAHAATVSGAGTSPSCILLAGWLSSRLGLQAVVQDNGGPGLTGVDLQLEDGSISITRTDGRTAVLSRTDQPERSMPLPRREVGDLLAEELRRLDADETYAEALAAATGTADLSDRPAQRSHVWQDPVDAAAPDPALTTS